MHCPRDKNELTQAAIHGVDLQKCAQCGGMYLEHGELNRVAEPTEGDLEFSTVDQDTFQHEDDYGPIECPRDPGVMMKKVAFLTVTNIILDYCATCQGFWVDGRELVRINEEVTDLNEADREVPDPPMVRLAEFFWNLPFPH